MSKRLIPCRDCGREISKNARKCPHCGRRRSATALEWIFALVVLLLAIWLMVGH